MSEMKGRATREAYGDEILELGRKNPDIFVIDADVGKSCKTIPFSQELPEQYVNVGIAEANCSWPCNLREDPVCYYLCGIRLYENVRADPPGNLLSSSQCQDCLLSRWFNSCK